MTPSSTAFPSLSVNPSSIALHEKPQNHMVPNIFNFISEDLSKVAKTYGNYPMVLKEVIPSTC